MAQQVQKQIVLPWAQVARIAFNSLTVRFFRSAITIGTLALAVAFVAFTWSAYDILNATWPHLGAGVREQILAKGYESTAAGFGASAKDRWLVALSLLVCVVGAVNAQLMAVTERFREIGTFKCLGALNSFVVRIFVLEAVYQGLIGGTVGGVLGILAATLLLLASAGVQVLLWWPVSVMCATFASSVLLSVVLSLLGVIYPALVAARMQPASALRSEQ